MDCYMKFRFYGQIFTATYRNGSHSFIPKANKTNLLECIVNEIGFHINHSSGLARHKLEGSITVQWVAKPVLTRSMLPSLGLIALEMLLIVEDWLGRTLYDKHLYVFVRWYGWDHLPSLIKIFIMLTREKVMTSIKTWIFNIVSRKSPDVNGNELLSEIWTIPRKAEHKLPVTYS